MIINYNLCLSNSNIWTIQHFQLWHVYYWLFVRYQCKEIRFGVAVRRNPIRLVWKANNEKFLSIKWKKVDVTSLGGSEIWKKKIKNQKNEILLFFQAYNNSLLLSPSVNTNERSCICIVSLIGPGERVVLILSKIFMTACPSQIWTSNFKQS